MYRVGLVVGPLEKALVYTVPRYYVSTQQSGSNAHPGWSPWSSHVTACHYGSRNDCPRFHFLVSCGGQLVLTFFRLQVYRRVNYLDVMKEEEIGRSSGMRLYEFLLQRWWSLEQVPKHQTIRLASSNVIAPPSYRSWLGVYLYAPMQLTVLPTFLVTPKDLSLCV